ncbi:MAG: hypothetical protein ACOYZ7_03925 [Chloroflexota bacterium]
MDPIITPIVIILGKYALDKGVELGKEIGPKALETARELFTAVLERVGQKRPETAAEFPQDPETYHKPLEKALEAEAQADPDFKAQLEALLKQYQQAAQEHAAAVGTSSQAMHTGEGDIMQNVNVTAGPGGIAVGRDIRGGVHQYGRDSET